MHLRLTIDRLERVGVRSYRSGCATITLFAPRTVSQPHHLTASQLALGDPSGGSRSAGICPSPRIPLTIRCSTIGSYGRGRRANRVWCDATQEIRPRLYRLIPPEEQREPTHQPLPHVLSGDEVGRHPDRDLDVVLLISRDEIAYAHDRVVGEAPSRSEVLCRQRNGQSSDLRYAM